MKSIKNYKGYIYTIPKAGTYLMSEFLSQIGSISTGWHISINNYLDTLGFDPETNTTNPTLTEKKRLYIASFKKVPVGHHAFGHLSPLYVPPSILTKDYKCLCVKRHPKEVLISEFIDFRYRRSDVDFVSRDKHKDSIKAFETYIKIDGSDRIKKICLRFAFLEESAKNPVYSELFGKERFYFLAFKKFLSEESGPQLAYEICKFFGVEVTPDQANQFRLAALSADNKTKSLDLMIDVPREAFWTKSALSLYNDLGFPAIEPLLGYSI